MHVHVAAAVGQDSGRELVPSSPAMTNAKKWLTLDWNMIELTLPYLPGTSTYIPTCLPTSDMCIPR
jgi:hypothetical protein